ncbi:hypothetical protein TL16_g09479 [Triparma laevis f. inornata]|uniref:Uncharacterized protein n=2 Tax=Triparma laevis TaxID=1534972 RepID=A0A9W7B184_9STRA|nr:hypothetical protein TrLO_g14968 [Triparma laevis f. longispina]GMH83087.1 hypothetical protein TL16_g09479 [Triparma laevis f. inornata]
MLGENVFLDCFELVPSSIDVRTYNSNSEELTDATSEVISHLRTQLRIAALEKVIAEQAMTITERDAEVATLTTEVVTLTTENAVQATEIAALKVANAPAAPTNDFMSTIDFKRHFVGFVHIEMLLVLREVYKEWNEVVKRRLSMRALRAVR